MKQIGVVKHLQFLHVISPFGVSPPFATERNGDINFCASERDGMIFNGYSYERSIAC